MQIFNKQNASPSYADLSDIVKKLDSSYKRIPIMKEIYADFITPIEAVRVLKSASHHVFLLESVENSNVQWGRFSFLGINPTMELSFENRTLYLSDTQGRHTLEDISPNEYIRSILSSYKTYNLSDMPPFTGGLVGFFSYDYIKYSEPRLNFENNSQNSENIFRDIDLMLFNDIIAFDSFKQKIIIISGVLIDDLESSYKQAEERIDRIISILKSKQSAELSPLKLESDFLPVFSKEEYCKMVEKAKRYIYEGDIFQVVLSNPIKASAKGSLFDTYRVLRTLNPSPYMFYFVSDNIEVAGASPETLVKLYNGKLYTYPLAGSRPRGKSREEDDALAENLLKDEKELAEHNMLVDLGRNDIGKVARIGSVKVEEYMQIVKYSHIMHISSKVTGQIADGSDMISALSSILPAGTLSGAPKVRACEIINELERGYKRGIYGGAVGYLDFAGNMDTCIAIRLVYKKGDEICIRSGAGIVYDSVPEREFEECINKASAVRKALELANNGIE